MRTKQHGQEMKNVKIIGLTGPSGAGKSELCACLAKFGIPNINADKIYHQLLVPPSPCLDEIAAYFGRSVIKEDGTLDRKKLADIVFANGGKEDLIQLNKITHSYVLRRMRELIATYSASFPVVIADVPLLFESEFYKECTVNVAVIADRAIRIDRIMTRDSLDYASAAARVEAQKNDSFYTSRADFTVYNNSDQSSLEEQARNLLDEIRRISGEN